MSFTTLFLLDWRQAIYQVLLFMLILTSFSIITSDVNNVVEGWWIEEEPIINSSSKRSSKKRKLPRSFFRRLTRFNRVWAVLLSIVILAAFDSIVLLTIHHQSLYYLFLLPLLYSVSKLFLPYLSSHPLAPLILFVKQIFLKKRKECLAKRTLKSIEKLKSTGELNRNNQSVGAEEDASERDEFYPKSGKAGSETKNDGASNKKQEGETKSDINSILEGINDFDIEEEYHPDQRKQVASQLAQIEEICFPNRISKELHKRLTECVKTMVSQLITEALIAEVDEQLGFKRYERTGEAKPSSKHRSGRRPRTVRTMWGTVVVQIPKLRKGGKKRKWKLLKRYERSLGPWLDVQIHLYTLGLSQKDLQEVLAIGFGQVLSVKAIEHLTEVVSKEKEAFLASPLENTYSALIIDGSNIKVMCQTGRKKKNARGQERIVKTKKQKVIISVIGVLADGRYETLYFETVESETIKSWKVFLKKVKDKGLDTDKLELIVSDGRKGIEKAIKEVFPKNVRHQRCIFHKLKNIGDNLSYEGLEIKEKLTTKEKRAIKTERVKEILADANKIYQKETVEESKKEIEVFKKKWEALESKSVKCFLEDVDLTLNYLRVDFRHKNRIRTTNLLERFFREFKQRSSEIGCFGSQEQAEALFYSIMKREKAKSMTGAWSL